MVPDPPLIYCEASGRLYHFSKSQTAHDKVSLIAASASLRGCEDNVCRSLGMSAKGELKTSHHGGDGEKMRMAGHVMPQTQSPMPGTEEA